MFPADTLKGKRAFLELIFTSVNFHFWLKLKVKRENIHFKIPKIANDMRFKWLLHHWIAKKINWIAANLNPLNSFSVTPSTIETLTMVQRPRVQWKDVPILKSINLPLPLPFFLLLRVIIYDVTVQMKQFRQYLSPPTKNCTHTHTYIKMGS